MKKFLITLLFFGCLFFIADKVLYLKMQSLPEREYDKRLESIILGKMNQEILIFGSSRAQHNVYSDLIEENLHLKTYNLGYRAASINFQLYLLKKVLLHNKAPKKILLTLDDDREFFLETSLHFRYDKLYPLIGCQEITNDLIKHKELSPFAVGFYSARIGWNQFTKPKLPTIYDIWTPKGTVLLDSDLPQFDKIYFKSKKYDIKNELSERLYAFTEFQTICKKKKIQLYLLIPPNFGEQNSVFITRIRQLVVAKETKLLYQKDTVFNNSNLFSDHAHLNKKGAIVYTKQIIQEIKL
jgi:hypothetical protein